MTEHRGFAVRLYAAALAILPRGIRREYGEQMLAVFTELATDARSLDEAVGIVRGVPVPGVRVWFMDPDSTLAVAIRAASRRG